MYRDFYHDIDFWENGGCYQHPTFIGAAMGVADLVGGGLLGSAASAAVTGAVIGGGISAVTGGNVLQGALTGGLMGGAGGAISGVLGGALSGSGAATATGADIANAAASSGVTLDSTTAASLASAGYTPAQISAIASNANGAMTASDWSTLASNPIVQTSSGIQLPPGLSPSAQQFLGSGAGQQVLGGLLQGAGALYAGGNAGQAGSTIANAATATGSQLANAATTAGAQQVAGLNNAQTSVNSTLANIQGLQAPTLAAGTTALNNLSQGLQKGGQFNTPFTMAMAQNMPAYQFALGQGSQSINNAAAAGGTQLSSANTQNLGNYASGLAAQYENQAFNQNLAQNQQALGGLQNLTNVGQNAQQQTQQALTQAGLNSQQIATGIGATNANATTGAANSLASGQMTAANANANALTAQGNIATNATGGIANNLATGYGLNSVAAPTTTAVGAVPYTPAVAPAPTVANTNFLQNSGGFGNPTTTNAFG